MDERNEGTRVIKGYVYIVVRLYDDFHQTGTLIEGVYADERFAYESVDEEMIRVASYRALVGENIAQIADGLYPEYTWAIIGMPVLAGWPHRMEEES